MVIVRIKGGLANQMFQYTFFFWLEKKHIENNLDIDTYIDNSMYYHHIPKQECDPYHNGYELSGVFGLKTETANIKEVYRLSDYRYNFFEKCYIKAKKIVFGGVKTQVVDIEGKTYDKKYASMDEVYFDGTWGDFKYANDYENDIREIFKFPQINDKCNIKFSNDICNCNSVAVHVRRGDYLNIRQGICLEKSYYDAAMEEIKNRVEKPVFYFFSDDIEWCKSNFLKGNNVFVNCNSGIDSFRDMQLMSMCKHSILANSTFSSWANWLNTNTNRLIIKPYKNSFQVEMV